MMMILPISSSSVRAARRLALLMMTTLPLAACAGSRLPPPNLPPPSMPKLIIKAPPKPRLDPACGFPWFGVSGCKGKDARAMLRLTVSDDIELRSRLGAVPDWFDSVSKSYQGRTR